MDITSNFQNKYSNKWGVLLQQKVSRIKEFVTVKTDCSGKVVFHDQFGTLEFEEKTTRKGTTKVDDAPTDRRALHPKFFHKTIGYDEFDGTKLGDLDVPVSQTIEGLRFAAGRQMDKVMLDAFLGTCYTGENGTTAVTFPTAQTVAKNFVESGTAEDTGLTLAKLRRVLQMFQENEAWNDDSAGMGDQLVMACSSAQMMNLLQTTEVTSRDFADVKALVEGKVDSFMGFKFLRSEYLPLTSGTRTCLAWVKSRALFGLWNDFKVKVSIRDDMEETLQIRAKFGCGATRLGEKGFVKVLCKQ